MIFVTSKNFDKKFKKLQKKVQVQAKERIILFSKNPFAPVLNNHALHGDKKSLRSINITGDIRLIYEDMGDFLTVRLLDIDTHSNLY